MCFLRTLVQFLVLLQVAQEASQAPGFMASLFPAESSGQAGSADSAAIQQLEADLKSRSQELALKRDEAARLRSQVRSCCFMSH